MSFYFKRIIFSRSIHVAANGRMSFFLIFLLETHAHVYGSVSLRTGPIPHPPPLWGHFPYSPGTQDLSSAQCARHCWYCFAQWKPGCCIRTLFLQSSLSCCFFPSCPLLTTGPGGAGGACQLLNAIADHSPFTSQKSSFEILAIRLSYDPRLLPLIYFPSLLCIPLIFLAPGSLPLSS